MPLGVWHLGGRLRDHQPGDGTGEEDVVTLQKESGREVQEVRT